MSKFEYCSTLQFGEHMGIKEFWEKQKYYFDMFYSITIRDMRRFDSFGELGGEQRQVCLPCGASTSVKGILL